MNDKGMDLKYKKFKDKFIDMIVFMKENGIANLNINVSELGAFNQDICDVSLSYGEDIEEFVYILGASEYKGKLQPKQGTDLKTADMDSKEKVVEQKNSSNNLDKEEDVVKKNSVDNKKSDTNISKKEDSSNNGNDETLTNENKSKNQLSGIVDKPVDAPKKINSDISISDLIKSSECLLKPRTLKAAPTAESIFNKYTPPVDDNSFKGEQYTLI